MSNPMAGPHKEQCLLARNERPLIIFLMGPTASGKTDLAMSISKTLPVQLISVDSALVYRNMDIGSAKPTQEELAQFPHQLIDIRDPSEPYSAADFCKDAKIAIEEAIEAGRIPLLVGGTMLYFKALLEGLAPMPVADSNIRARIELKAQKEGWPSVHRELAEIDPEMAVQIHPNHSQRLSRALEVFYASGKTMTQLRAEQRESGTWDILEQYRVHQLAITPRDRSVLHHRIQKRLALMFDAGFVDEVEKLYERGDLHEELPAIRAVGYRQVWKYIAGEYDLETAKEKSLVATRQLAKRQLTWLRGWQYPLSWVYTENESGEPYTRRQILEQALNFLP
ncbi:tRNA (adenosine(37)-N6)-dimethylallyltransferase MiaA [Marinibactrum halimedae]|uniref:tRNA dimethylallyltransferase n=1 Tax=Marinibactrum halimedae TaxID=1444977 RepID=A0AA37T6L9_9GAMM|nr:tRNA (adenosine(37)-N6)-dimethylallyltransferase MiaA [Marinibactrum halimedae]MCD9459723.1 tRNA (adenosine(37)-N6)-dimethylallyltransferase MiaA [Marinibactrum halimedae]GLS24520.1 tRNA dimethylallyltransferase [Marinibactrum halimedae]